MHTNFNNEDTMGCNRMVGRCLHANYGIRRAKCTFYPEVFVYRACINYVVTVSVHTVNLMSGETMFTLMLSEQHHQRSCKGWGGIQREILAHCARNLRFGPQFYNQPTNQPTHPTNKR